MHIEWNDEGEQAQTADVPFDLRSIPFPGSAGLRLRVEERTRTSAVCSIVLLDRVGCRRARVGLPTPTLLGSKVVAEQVAELVRIALGLRAETLQEAHDASKVSESWSMSKVGSTGAEVLEDAPKVTSVRQARVKGRAIDLAKSIKRAHSERHTEHLAQWVNPILEALECELKRVRSEAPLDEAKKAEVVLFEFSPGDDNETSKVAMDRLQSIGREFGLPNGFVRCVSFKEASVPNTHKAVLSLPHLIDMLAVSTEALGAS